jgi:hypothetical protein
LVEQRTENPRVVGSIPTLATIFNEIRASTRDLLWNKRQIVFIAQTRL